MRYSVGVSSWVIVGAVMNKLFRLISGQGCGFELEHLLFNSLIFILIIFGVLGTVLNLLIGLHWLVDLLSLIGIIFLGVLFHHSRVLGHFTVIHIWTLVLVSLGIMGSIFFFNGGAEGPVVFILLMLMIITLIISPERTQGLIFGTFFIAVVGVYLIDYWFGHEYTYGYHSRSSRYIDVMSTIAYCMIFISMTIITFKRSYNRERKESAINNSELLRLNGALVKKNEQIQLLMRELNHRVKNNLQVVSDMLNLQATRSNDGAIATALREGKDRLMSMALLHKKLYEEGDVNQIGLEEYVLDLQAYLIKESTNYQITLTNEINNVMLSPSQAVPFGLILNEIYTNIQKHAFTDLITNRKISTKCLSDNSNLKIEITDNGVSIPGEKVVNWKGSFGLELINLLVIQLDGTWGIVGLGVNQGTAVCIEFPIVMN